MTGQDGATVGADCEGGVAALTTEVRAMDMALWMLVGVVGAGAGTLLCDPGMGTEVCAASFGFGMMSAIQPRTARYSCVESLP